MSNLAGPFTEFSLHSDFINRRKQYANIPFTFFGPISKWIWAFIFMGTNIVTGYFGFDPLVSLTPAFAAQPYWWKIVWLEVSSFSIRIKYFLIWCFQNGNVYASGYCYNGIDEKGNHKWDRVIPLDPTKIEFGTTIREVMDNWHHCSSIWT
jgi:hypothetical protein